MVSWYIRCMCHSSEMERDLIWGKTKMKYHETQHKETVLLFEEMLEEIV